LVAEILQEKFSFFFEKKFLSQKINCQMSRNCVDFLFLTKKAGNLQLTRTNVVSTLGKKAEMDFDFSSLFFQ